MKRKTTAIFATVIITLAIGMTAFKENYNSTESIVGKWILVNTIRWVTYSGKATVKDTISAHPGEYMDVRKNGRLYFYLWEDNSKSFKYDTTSTYRVQGNNLYLLHNGIDTVLKMQIQTLTSNELLMHAKIVTPKVTEEHWVKLRR